MTEEELARLPVHKHPAYTIAKTCLEALVPRFATFAVGVQVVSGRAEIQVKRMGRRYRVTVEEVEE